MQAYEKDQIIVVTVAADQCATLGKVIEAYLEQGKRAFVFDMGKATFLNSVNIATIIAARNKITASGGKAAVANLTDSIKAGSASSSWNGSSISIAHWIQRSLWCVERDSRPSRRGWHDGCVMTSS